jgi:hypothetical protein
MTRGIATADVTSYWGYVYPFYLATGEDDEHILARAAERTENIGRPFVR